MVARNSSCSKPHMRRMAMAAAWGWRCASCSSGTKSPLPSGTAISPCSKPLIVLVEYSRDIAAALEGDHQTGGIREAIAQQSFQTLDGHQVLPDALLEGLRVALDEHAGDAGE